MSAEAQAHVWKKSPYKGQAFILHLAIADSANDQYHYEFFMSQVNAAKKARTIRTTVNKILARMVADGWLTIVDGGDHLPRGIVRYRFEFREDAPTVYEARRRPVPTEHMSDGPTCDEKAHDPVPTGHTEHKREHKKKDEHKNGFGFSVTSSAPRIRGATTGRLEPMDVERAVRDMRG